VPATLLLADDSVTIQRVIELTFADEDVRVVAVSDGEAAIAHIESAPPDIVLADVGMPGTSGYDVAQHVKRTPRLAHIPVVLLTGAFEPIDRTRAALVGCDGVLAKPFEPQLVIARVKELLESRMEQTAPLPVPRRTDLDDYFDQLDVAFANLANTSATRKPPPEPDIEPAVGLSYASPLADFEIADAVAGDDPGAPLPQASADKAAAFARGLADETSFITATPAERVIGVPSPDRSAEQTGRHERNDAPLPSISETFAALLAAERNEPPAAHAPASPPRASPVSQLDDQTINRIAKLVAEQLSDRAIREIAGEIVAATAERLVRQEIERIKSTIK
jgi:CheY-like chemotaxis protein